MKHKPEDDEEEITEKNDVGVGVKVKDAWFNFTESMHKHLWQTYKFLPNGRTNGKIIFSKFRLTRSMLAEKNYYDVEVSIR